MQASTIQAIPREVWAMIFGLLKPLDLQRCCQVSHEWKINAGEDNLWRRIFIMSFEYEKFLPIIEHNISISWREAYMKRIIIKYLQTCSYHYLLFSDQTLAADLDARYLSLIRKCIRAVMANRFGPKINTSMFIRMILPKKIQDLLVETQFTSRALKMGVNKVLQRVIELIVFYLHKYDLSTNQLDSARNSPRSIFGDKTTDDPNDHKYDKQRSHTRPDIFSRDKMRRDRTSVDSSDKNQPYNCGSLMFLLQLMNKIFSPNMPFYYMRPGKVKDEVPFVENERLRQIGDSSEQRFTVKKLKKGTKKVMLSTSKEGTELYLANVNYFGKLGGFDLILSFIKSLPPMNLSIVFAVLQPLRHVSDILSRSFAKPYMPQLSTNVFNYLAAHAGQKLSRSQRVHYQNIGALLQNIVAQHWSRQTIQEAFDMYNFQVWKDNFFSPKLKNQIASVKFLLKILAAVSSREEQKKKMKRQFWKLGSKNNNEARGMSIKTLLELFKANAIVDNLLKRDPRVIKASFEVLTFLAQHGQFEAKKLEELAHQYNIPVNV
eukprot:TRINITY_DN14320_c0_g1_i1.p1 TRINITY_DN14320_c0_g1~~TRINITY_DN14320_c0_g1_i1.p1  ORF type:complete len:546 (+),score=100.89 TRINITY_DN14320_c0_g1_i1:103-1740(+)